MGQKTHPRGFRLGIVAPWKSRWYAERDFPKLLVWTSGIAIGLAFWVIVCVELIP